MSEKLIESKKSRSCPPYPSLMSMGIVLAIAIGLIAICGWKIFLLESEQEEIKRERLLLDRDKDAFLTYGGELPQMAERHRLLTQEVAELENRRSGLEERNDELDKKTRELDARASRLTGAVTALESQLQALEASLAKEKAEIAQLTPERSTLQKEVATLKAEQSALNESLTQKRKQEAALTANLEGLERSGAHARELLSRLTADQQVYETFEQRLQAMTSKFDAVLARSDMLTTEYGGRMERLEKFVTQMDQQLTLLDTDRQAISFNLEALKKDRAAYATLLKQTGEHKNLMQAQLESLTSTNKKFSAAMENVQNLDNRLQTTLKAESGALKKMAQEDAAARAALSSSADALKQDIQTLRAQLEHTQANSGHIGDLLTRQREKLDELAAAMASLDSMIEKNRQASQAGIEAGTKLGHTAQSLVTQADIFRTRLDLAANQGSQFEKLMDSQATRMKELGNTTRQLADEIGDTRRRGVQLEAILKEIQTTLDRQGHEPQPVVNTGSTQEPAGATP